MKLLPPVVVAHPHVRVDPGVLAGSPHIVGSRVLVRRLWAWVKGGAEVETLVKRYPNITRAQIYDALSFAYDNQDLIAADLVREEAFHRAQAALAAAHGEMGPLLRPGAALAP